MDYSTIEPVEIDVRIKDGDIVPVLGGLEVIHTPGHTPGHICLYSRQFGTLLAGDLFFNTEGFELCTPQYTLHTPTAAISAKRIAGMNFDNLLIYHGPSFIGEARAKVQELVKTL